VTSRNVWRRLFASGVLEATDGSPSDADGFSWTEAALALFVVGGRHYLRENPAKQRPRRRPGPERARRTSIDYRP